MYLEFSYKSVTLKKKKSELFFDRFLVFEHLSYELLKFNYYRISGSCEFRLVLVKKDKKH